MNERALSSAAAASIRPRSARACRNGKEGLGVGVYHLVTPGPGCSFPDRQGSVMLKFFASTIGVIFLIGLLVVVGLLMLIF